MQFLLSDGHVTSPFLKRIQLSSSFLADLADICQGRRIVSAFMFFLFFFKFHFRLHLFVLSQM